MAVDFSKLDKAFKGIEKEFGKGMVIDKEEFENIQRVPSSSPLLQHITGGGYPRGKIIEIYGPESSGKSLIAQHIGKDFQAVGEFVGYIDMEFSFQYDFAEKIGLDTSEKKFKLFQPDSAEKAFTIAEEITKAGVGLIVFDSVATMTPDAEMSAGYSDQQMGSQARVMGKGLRKLASILSKNGTTVIFINQIRMKIGVMFGNPETTPGGNALPFYACLRLDTRRKDFLEDSKDSEPYGVKAQVTSKKSKISPPKRKGQLTIYYNNGVDTLGEYIDFGITFGFIEKSGSWYSINGERAQGKENLSNILKLNDTVREKLKSKVIQMLSTGVVEDEEVKSDEDSENDYVKRL
jgi:recombination protein RecA